MMLFCIATAAFLSTTRYTLFSRIKSMLFSAGVCVMGVIVALLLNSVPKPIKDEQCNSIKVPPSPIAAHFQIPRVTAAPRVTVAPKQAPRNLNTNTNKYQGRNNRRGNQAPTRPKPAYRAPVPRAPRAAPPPAPGWGNVQHQINTNDRNDWKQRAADEQATAHLPRASFQTTHKKQDGGSETFLDL